MKLENTIIFAKLRRGSLFVESTGFSRYSKKSPQILLKLPKEFETPDCNCYCLNTRELLFAGETTLARRIVFSGKEMMISAV